MEALDRQRALDATLAQIDRAFGKGSAAHRDYVKVWTDRYTEERVLDYVRSRVEGYLEDDDGTSTFHDDFWFDLGQEMERGEHRIIPHPFDRMYPPVTMSERFGLLVRRFLGWFQRGAD